MKHESSIAENVSTLNAAAYGQFAVGGIEAVEFKCMLWEIGLSKVLKIAGQLNIKRNENTK